MKIKALKSLIFLYVCCPVYGEEPWSYYLDHSPTAEVDTPRDDGRQEYAKAQGSLGSFFIQVYRDYLSPIDGSRCPYAPTCSRYGQESFQRHGYLKGSLMTADRLIRCHPQQRENRYDPPILFP